MISTWKLYFGSNNIKRIIDVVKIETIKGSLVITNKRIINEVYPYNDIIFKSCFYSSLFPVLRFFKKEISAFLFNELFIYQLDDKKVQISHENIQISDDETILVNMGIQTKKINKSEEVISQLINSIGNNKLVIIFIDCYYESIRPDTFLKLHRPHYILICGYDYDYKEFDIIENNYLDSQFYENRKISFEDVERSYYGGLEYYVKGSGVPTYFEYGINNQNIDTELKNNNQLEITLSNFSTLLSRTQLSFFNSLTHVKSFRDKLQHIVLVESELKSFLLTNFDELTRNLNTIINNLKLEKYRLEKYFNADFSSIDSLGRVINNWTIIRGVIWKFNFSGVYNEKSFVVLLNKINEIVNDHNSYFTNLCSFFGGRNFVHVQTP
ncbi:hypothetical protein SAMN05444162_3943 [Paenibacillaceae bacterium GAS479]|nr:hypothetical protein SAMN05444162_3943 [Paenibacillaceae bacterium GAS479]